MRLSQPGRAEVTRQHRHSGLVWFSRLAATRNSWRGVPTYAVGASASPPGSESETAVLTAERGNGSTWDRCQSGSGNLYVMLRRVEARPDGTGHLAIDDGGKP